MFYSGDGTLIIIITITIRIILITLLETHQLSARGLLNYKFLSVWEGLRQEDGLVLEVNDIKIISGNGGNHPQGSTAVLYLRPESVGERPEVSRGGIQEHQDKSGNQAS